MVLEKYISSKYVVCPYCDIFIIFILSVKSSFKTTILFLSFTLLGCHKLSRIIFSISQMMANILNEAKEVKYELAKNSDL